MVFTLGGTVRYDSADSAGFAGPYGPVSDASGNISLAHHCRIVLTANTNAHWLDTDPNVQVAPDRAYLTATKFLPAYYPNSIASSTLSSYSANYVPGGVAYLSGGMGTPGFAPDIGMLPEASASWLISGDERAKKAVLAAGFSLGSYCIHYRDENTNRPVLFASHPNANTQNGAGKLPDPSGSPPYRYATSHHPAAAYLAYLVTGWHWFLEEMQFQTTFSYLERNPSYRANDSYYFYMSAWAPGGNNQGGPRAQAWQWRTAAMVAACTPDDDAWRTQMVNTLEYNATRFRQEFDTGGQYSNNLGVVDSSAPFNAGGVSGIWQVDFMSASVGLTWDLEVVSDGSKMGDLEWVRDFLYGSVVGRLGAEGDPNQWSYRDAANYQIAVGSGSFTWAENWGAAYALNFSGGNSTVRGSDLQGGNIGSPNGLATSYWGNLHPALAYAVDHNAPGARAGYDRMIQATNYASKAQAFSSQPVWGIVPRSL